MKIYIDWHDHWIGHYLGERHHYVCIIPMVVIRWQRKEYRKMEKALKKVFKD